MSENRKDGHTKAFKPLFEQYRYMVYNVCYRMTGSREDAEDAAQDVFIKIYKSIDKFRGEAKLSSWIYRITVYTCLNRQRRKKLAFWISLDFLLTDETAIQPFDEESIPDTQMERSETERLIQQAIQSLPFRQKTALILQRYENLSNEQIAEVMNTSISAVESLLHRTKYNLAPKLIALMK